MEEQRKQGFINKQRLFGLIVLLLLLALLIVLLWWWFGRPRTTPPVVEPPLVNTNVVLPPQKPVVQNPPINQVDPLTDGELQVMILARNFTERYGSWSTESNFQNLIDLYPWITQRLQREFEQTMVSSPASSQFKGMQTKVLRIDIKTLTDRSADVVVTTQRVATDAGLKNSITYEEIFLSVVQQGEFWYVDSATWQ